MIHSMQLLKKFTFSSLYAEIGSLHDEAVDTVGAGSYAGLSGRTFPVECGSKFEINFGPIVGHTDIQLSS